MKMTCRTPCTRQVAARLVIALTSAVAWMANAENAQTQSLYPSPEAAVTALHAAVKAGDTNTLKTLFGPVLNEIANTDPIQCERDMAEFAQHLADFSELSAETNGTMVLHVGKERWPFPIPLARKNDTWFFDTAAGKEEILNRRIGHNELSAIEICHAYVQAQRDYAARDPEGSGVMEYAQRIRSSAGRKNGLYWEAETGEKESPFGPLVAKAAAEGYTRNELSAAKRQHNPFHGYFFKVLKKQGDHAPGGEYDYIINDHMLAGFALLAYPAQWGNSGIMTLIVNQQGKVYEKNLGERTAELVDEIDEYDPDATWKPAE